MLPRCTYLLPKYAAGYMSSLLSNLVTLRSPVFRFSVARDPSIPVETADQITHKDRHVNDIRSHSGLVYVVSIAYPVLLMREMVNELFRCLQTSSNHVAGGRKRSVL